MKSLINLNSIIEAPILTNPWPHKIIDNILTEETFTRFKEAALFLSKCPKDDDYFSDGIWPSEFMKFGLDNLLENDCITIANQLLSIREEIFNQFPFYNKSKLGYFNIPRFNYSINNLNSSIHDEGITKTMALIIYLTPESSIGTKLYNGPSPDDLIKEINWKPNRAFLMVSQPGVTWHSYKSLGNSRYTLNFYYEKMEALDNFEKINLERKLWFYEKMGSGNLVGNL